jgi:hypothetical protein
VVEFGVVVVVLLFGTVLGEVAVGPSVLLLVPVVLVPFMSVPAAAPVVSVVVPVVPAALPVVPVAPVVPTAPLAVGELLFTVDVPFIVLVPVAPVVPAVAAGLVPLRPLGSVEVPVVVPTLVPV